MMRRFANETVLPSGLDQLVTELSSLNSLLRDRLFARNPIDMTIMISDQKPWSVDYQGYKHIFLWIPVTAGYTLSFEDYGQGPVIGQSWVNLGIPQGIKMKTSGQSSLVEVMLRFTDEAIP